MEITRDQVHRLSDELRLLAASLDVLADSIEPSSRLHYRDDSLTAALWRLIIDGTPTGA